MQSEYRHVGGADSCEIRLFHSSLSNRIEYRCDERWSWLVLDWTFTEDWADDGLYRAVSYKAERGTCRW